MKCFVWEENLETGAYHGDGSAVVFAKDFDHVVRLVTEWEAQKEERSYRWARPISAGAQYRAFDLPDETPAQVVCLTVGCDC